MSLVDSLLTQVDSEVLDRLEQRRRKPVGPDAQGNLAASAFACRGELFEIQCSQREENLQQHRRSTSGKGVHFAGSAPGPRLILPPCGRRWTTTRPRPSSPSDKIWKVGRLEAEAMWPLLPYLAGSF